MEKSQENTETIDINSGYSLLEANNIEDNKSNNNGKTKLNDLDIDYLNELKDDEELLAYLKEVAYTKESVDKFKEYFFGKAQEKVLESSDFISIGVFEDLSYFPWWTNNDGYAIATQEFKENQLFYWRRIKGDGNCYYRAVLINYLELLILNSYELDQIEIFFSLIKDVVFTEFPNDKKRFKTLSLTILLSIYEYLQQSIFEKYSDEMEGNKKSIFYCFDVLYRAYNKSDLFEKSLIMWIRVKLTHFLKLNLDLEFNGLKLVQCIPGFELEDDLTYNRTNVLNYIDNELMKMDEYVEGYPLYIMSLILFADVHIFYIDNNYKPIDVDFRYYGDINNDINPIKNYLFNLKSSGKYRNDINLIFRVPHYDTIYRAEVVNKIHELYNNTNVLIIEGQFEYKEYNNYKTNLFYNTATNRRNNNPLTQLLDGNANNQTNLQHAGKIEGNQIIIDISKIQIEDEDKCVEKFHTSKHQNAPKTNFSICIMCYKEAEHLVYYQSCKHSFCIECFQNYFNAYLNTKQKKIKFDLKSMHRIDEIFDILKNINKYKFIKCLVNDCTKEYQYYDLEKILERYYTLLGQVNVKKKEKSTYDENNTLDNSNSEVGENEKLKKKEKFCKYCQNIALFVKFSDGCEVCRTCQRTSVFKENGKNTAIIYDKKNKIKINKCIGCRRNALQMDDYKLLFSEKELNI